MINHTKSYPEILNEFFKMEPVEKELVADFGVRYFQKPNENKNEHSLDFQNRLVDLYRVHGSFNQYLNGEKQAIHILGRLANPEKIKRFDSLEYKY